MHFSCKNCGFKLTTALALELLKSRFFSFDPTESGKNLLDYCTAAYNSGVAMLAPSNAKTGDPHQ